MTKLKEIILRSTYATRPSPGIPGRLFGATDSPYIGTIWRDTGSAWEVWTESGSADLTDYYSKTEVDALLAGIGGGGGGGGGGRYPGATKPLVADCTAMGGVTSGGSMSDGANGLHMFLPSPSGANTRAVYGIRKAIPSGSVFRLTAGVRASWANVNGFVALFMQDSVTNKVWLVRWFNQTQKGSIGAGGLPESYMPDDDGADVDYGGSGLTAQTFEGVMQAEWTPSTKTNANMKFGLELDGLTKYPFVSDPNDIYGFRGMPTPTHYGVCVGIYGTSVATVPWTPPALVWHLDLEVLS